MKIKSLDQNAGKWLSFGASIRGSRHKRRGEANQDSWTARRLPCGDLIVVSDGLGSMPHGREGSLAACAAVTMAVWETGAKGDFNSLPERIHANWLRQLRPQEPELAGATCLFALVTDDLVWLGQLGDGMVCAAGEEPVLLPVENEFLNVTYCLGASHKPQLWKFGSHPVGGFNGIMLATDGISADIAEEQQPAFALELLRNYGSMQVGQRSAALTQMLETWPVASNSDDKTLACLWRNQFD